jgi:hypothetical protein
MASALAGGGPGFVMSPDEVVVAERQRAEEEQQAKAAANTSNDRMLGEIAGHILRAFSMMKRHFATHITPRYQACTLANDCEYDPGTLADIAATGMSRAKSGLTPSRCAGATALLNEVYLQGDRPWGFTPTPRPKVPDDVLAAIETEVDEDLKSLEEKLGGPEAAAELVDALDVHERIELLKIMAEQALIDQVWDENEKSELAVDDIMVEGGFYDALRNVLIRLPVNPTAIMKGPCVRMQPQLTWVNGKPVKETRAKIFFEEISPYDFWWSPGVSDIAHADCIERKRLTRHELNSYIGVAGYDEEAIRNVLREYSRGSYQYTDTADQSRATSESRESPYQNETGTIDCLEFQGHIQGKMLLDYGMTEEQIPDADQDYLVQAWLIGQFVIKIQLSSSLRDRHQYYVTSYRKQPGTVIGKSLAEIIAPRQKTIDMAWRSIENNMAFSAGPITVVNRNRLAPGESVTSIQPYMVIDCVDDPEAVVAQNRPPVEFQIVPNNVQQNMAYIQDQEAKADEECGIPKFAMGATQGGAIGRTASGMAMSMSQAAKMLKNVAGNIDSDIIAPMLQELRDMCMYADAGVNLRGDEAIVVKGVTLAMTEEVMRQRELEFLQITNNPGDMALMGDDGRRGLLADVASRIGHVGKRAVMSKQELKLKVRLAAIAAKAAAAQQAAAIAQNPQLAAPNGGSPPKQPGIASQPSPKGLDANQASANSMRAMVSQHH